MSVQLPGGRDRVSWGGWGGAEADINMMLVTVNQNTPTLALFVFLYFNICNSTDYTRNKLISSWVLS